MTEVINLGTFVSASNTQTTQCTSAVHAWSFVFSHDRSPKITPCLTGFVPVWVTVKTVRVGNFSFSNIAKVISIYVKTYKFSHS